MDLQYNRNDITFERGQFRVRGDTVELCPAGREDALRVEFFGDEIERITRFEPLTGEKLETPANTMIFPAKQFVTTERQDEARHPRHPRGTGRRASRSSRSTASCSKPSASRCARNTIWK